MSIRIEGVGQGGNRYENMTPEQAIVHLREHIYSVCYPLTTALCAEMIKMIERQKQQLQAAEQQNAELQAENTRLELELQNQIMNAEARCMTCQTEGIKFKDGNGCLYKIYWDSGDASVGIMASWVCDNEFSTPEMVDEAVKEATAQLRADLAQRDAEGGGAEGGFGEDCDRKSKICVTACGRGFV